MGSTVSLFETTLRGLGGFLSAYYLSNEKIYLDKAIDLGNCLVKAFSTESGLPYVLLNIILQAFINLNSGSGSGGYNII